MFYGVKVFRSREPVRNALLCHHTPFCYYHVEVGVEPEIAVSVRLIIENISKKKLKDVMISFIGLRDDYGQQVLEVRTPPNVTTRKEEMSFVHTAEIPLLLPRKKEVINVSYRVKMKAFEVSDFEAVEDEYYLSSMPLQRCDKDEIKSLAKSLKGSDDVESVKNVLRWLKRNITYERNYSRMGSIVALGRRKGSCIEVADLAVALLRAIGIPARVVRGYYVRDYHAWVEILTNKGWVPVEPLAGLVGAIGVPWLSYMGEKSPKDKEVLSNCKYCRCRWEVMLE